MQTRTSHARHLGDIAFAMGEFVAEFVPAACDAPATYQKLACMKRLVESSMILVAREVEQSDEWKRQGFASCADYLAAGAGTTVASARSLLETSRRVAEQPKTQQALRTGELSGRKAELVAGAIDAVPEAGDELLELARTAPVAKVKEECLRTKARKNGDKNHRRIRKERSARHYTDSSNAWHFHATGTVDDGAKFVKVLEGITDEFFKQAYAEGRNEPRTAYGFDALIEMARRASGEGTGKKSSNRPQLLGLVRVDHSALVRGAVEGEEVCEIAGLGPIPARVARDLLGDAVVKLILSKRVDVANVTHLGRGPTVAQKIALWWRTPQCTTLDCTRVQRIQFDHRKEWRTTHHTRLDEGDGLCGHCHDLKTRFGWALVEGNGKRPLVPPDDPRHPKNKPK
jgi:hypothetical protein